MREIKFRGWDKKKKRWFNKVNKHVLVGDEIVVSVRYNPVQGGTLEPNCYQLTWPEIENLEIMQYTSLKDKNGKEIYEGDIVRKEVTRTPDVKHIEGAVSFVDGMYLLRKIPLGWPSQECLEIIGNIHENPEFLKGGN